MPWIKSEDASRALNRDPEGEVAAAMEKESKRLSQPNGRVLSSKIRAAKGSKMPGKIQRRGIMRMMLSTLLREAHQWSLPPTIVTLDTRRINNKLFVPSLLHITSKSMSHSINIES